MRPRSLRRPITRRFASLWKGPAAPLALAALSCLAGWDVPGAFAKATPASLPKKVKKSAQTPEVYSALENTGSTPDSDFASEVYPTPRLQASLSEKAPPRAETPKPKAPSFDAVPSHQRPWIAQRLALIETLIVDHGRAYDYRTLTLQQLQALVVQLGGTKSVKQPEQPSTAPPTVRDSEPETRPAPPNLAQPPQAPSLSDETYGAGDHPEAESYAVSEGGEPEDLIPAPSLSD